MNRLRFDTVLGCLVILAIAVMPLLTSDDFLLTVTTLIMIWSVFAVGFNFVFGSLGMVSFGHASFLGIGGYGLAIATMRYGLSFECGLLVGCALAAFCAWIFSFFALRVSGIFFALVTLALSQLLFILADSKLRDLTGGADGIPGVGRPDLLGIDFFSTLHFYWYVAVIFLVVMGAVAVLRMSPFGRVVLSVQQNEIRTETLGYNVHRIKQITFLISGGISGIAGGLLASLLMYVNPQMLHWSTSGDVIIMTLLGGSASLWGPVAGVLIFEGLKEWLSGWTQYWYGILGLVFILATMYFPKGVLGEVQELAVRLQKRRGER